MPVNLLWQLRIYLTPHFQFVVRIADCLCRISYFASEFRSNDEVIRHPPDDKKGPWLPRRVEFQRHQEPSSQASVRAVIRKNSVMPETCQLWKLRVFLEKNHKY